MSAPSELPRWATAGGAQITHPSSGFQDLGYEPNTPAGAGVRNWLDNLAYQWINWLNGQDIANTAAHAAINAAAATIQAKVLAHYEIDASLWPLAPIGVFSNPSSVTGIASDLKGRLCAVGLAGHVATSDDLGNTWTSRTSGTSVDLRDVFWEFGTSLFVAVGDTGKLITSPNGVTWTSRTTGVSDSLTLMSRDLTHILVGGDQGQFIYSTNITSVYTSAPIPGATGVISSMNPVSSTRIVVSVKGGSATRDTCVFITDTLGATWTAVALPGASTGRVVDIARDGAGGLHGLVVDTVSGQKSFVVSTDLGSSWLAEGGSLADTATDYMFAHGLFSITMVPSEKNLMGAVFYPGGWRKLFERGFGSISRMLLLPLDGTSAYVWVGLGRNGVVDDRGNACFSMPFMLTD